MSDFRWFREDLCDRCGECFSSCNVLQLSDAVAQKDIEALIENRLSDSLAFKHCLTCNVCDLTCPQGADPYELILQRFGQYQEKHGLPFVAKMVVPSEIENLWSGLQVLMDEDETSLIKDWEENLKGKHDEILLTGFYANIVPFLMNADFLSELRPKTAGSVMLWGCGGDTNKLGNADQTDRVVELIERHFSEMGVSKVICFMEAEAAMLGEVLPKRFGASFPFEVCSLDDWILEKMQEGTIKPVNKLDMKVTVHDNCMSRYFNGRPQAVLREIVQRCGCRLEEMEHNRNNALCCGWAATIPTLFGNQSDNPVRTLMNLLYHLDRRLQEAIATGANAMVASCPACYIFLSLIAELENVDIKVLHPIELIQMATGETPDKRMQKRSWDLLAITLNLLSKWATSRDVRRRFYVKPLDPNILEPLPELSEKEAKRLSDITNFLKSFYIQNWPTKVFVANAVKASIAVYGKSLKSGLKKS